MCIMKYIFIFFIRSCEMMATIFFLFKKCECFLTQKNCENVLLCITVNGIWVPFVSEQCGQLVSSNPGQYTLLISYTAPCLTFQVS